VVLVPPFGTKFTPTGVSRHRSNGCLMCDFSTPLDGVRVRAVLGFTPEKS
jgi:hypothetical protein